jgi:hypothetical protein
MGEFVAGEKSFAAWNEQMSGRADTAFVNALLL